MPPPLDEVVADIEAAFDVLVLEEVETPLVFCVDEEDEMLIVDDIVVVLSSWEDVTADEDTYVRVFDDVVDLFDVVVDDSEDVEEVVEPVDMDTTRI